MKKLALAIALTLTSAVAAAEGTWHLQLAGFSKHFNTTETFNEVNTGVGIRYQATEDLGYQVGTFRNSLSNQAVYGLVQYTPFHMGPVAVGAFAGLSSGYNAPFVGGLMANVSAGASSVTIRFIPEVKNVTPSTLAIEYGIRF